jgi:hypothetical protein
MSNNRLKFSSMAYVIPCSLFRENRRTDKFISCCSIRSTKETFEILTKIVKLPVSKSQETGENLRNLYSSSNNIRVIQSRRMRLAGHVAHMRDEI